MGFGEAEVRKALLASAEGFHNLQSLESVLRSALHELTSSRVTRAA
jgi:hypothetical protein